MLNTQVPRFNAKLRDLHYEDVDCLHLPDTVSLRENNNYNPPRSALLALAAKLLQSGAEATIVAPYSPNKQWYQDRRYLAAETLHYPPSRDLLFPGRLETHGGVMPLGWSFVVFRLPLRHGSTHVVEI
jgi:hypothetical protein